MEQKSWLWRKKFSEKTIVAGDKGKVPMKGSEHEMNMVDKEQSPETSMNSINGRMPSALSEFNSKDDLGMEHIKVAEEATAGWKRSEEVAHLKQELDDALQLRLASEERIIGLETALKECMQQLRCIREEHEQIIHESVTKASKEFDEVRTTLEEMLSEASKRLTKLSTENSQLNKFLRVNEKIIKDLQECKFHLEEDFDALNARVDTTEKENFSLRHKVHMLEKELKIRIEERELNHLSVDASHKKLLESMKRIAKLETECQKLRLLARKRGSGPAALTKMRNEVEGLGRDAVNKRKSKSNSVMLGSSVTDSMSELDNCLDSPSERIDLLIERLCEMEEENKILKDSLLKKNDEYQHLRTLYECTVTKLSQVETQIAEISKDKISSQIAKSIPMSYDVGLTSISENGLNEDEISCAESWASALISELEHFRSGKQRVQSCRSSAVSDISLMDDFVEMERLAIVAMDKPVDRSHVPLDDCSALRKADSGGCLSEASGKELVPNADSRLDSCESDQEMQLKYQAAENSPGWIQEIWMVIMQQSYLTHRSVHKIIDEVCIALKNINLSVLDEANALRKTDVSSSSNPSHISAHKSWKSPPMLPVVDMFDVAHDMDNPSKYMDKQQFHSSINNSISKVIELIQGMKLSLSEYNNKSFCLENTGNTSLFKEPETCTGYTVRVFQWKSSELSDVLKNFTQICTDLLHGKADLKILFRELGSTLDWIMNHCFSIQDVSCMEDTIKKHFDWDERLCESEHEVGIASPLSEKRPYASKECNHAKVSLSALFSSTNHQSIISEMNDRIELQMKDENRRLKDEVIDLESKKISLEERLQSTTDKNEVLLIQIQELEQRAANLQGELNKLTELKHFIEDQIEGHKLMNEDLDTQLTTTRNELSKAHEKILSLEAEFEKKNHCCQELEAKCLELRLQLESLASKESCQNVAQVNNQLRTDLEISAASEKLAECQETILSLGKQLKALASPRDANVLDKVVATPTHSKNNRRPSLLDQMAAEDDSRTEELKSPKTKEIMCTGDVAKPENPNAGLFYGRTISALNNTSNASLTIFQASPVKTSERSYSFDEVKHKAEAVAGSLAIVPKKQRGASGLFWKKLLRKKK